MAVTNGSSRRTWWLLFGLLSVLLLAQNLGTPRNASPDELGHLVRAAGLVRGDVQGAKTDSVANRSMDVPWWVDEPRPDCYAAQPYAPASCATVDREDRSPQLTAAGGYPPLAHLIAGVGTLLPFEARDAWFARILLAETCALLLASALTLALRRGGTAAAAVWLASTPMVVFLIGTVNPSGLFACAAIALWVALLDDDAGDRQCSRWLAVGAAATMLLTRPDGLLFVALIVALILGLRGWRWLVDEIRAGTNPQRVVLAAAVVGALVWTVAFPSELLPVSDNLSRSTASWFTEIVSRTGDHLREAIGVLGWLDTDIPLTAVMLWLVALGALVGLAAQMQTRRQLRILLLAAASTIVVPWALELARAHRAGLYWQGRYGLPLFVGVVILAGWVRSPDRDSAGLSRFVVIAHGAVLILAFAQMLRRFGVGAAGSLLPWRWDGAHIPLPALLLLAIHIAAVVGLVNVLTRAPRKAPASLADRV